MNIVMVVSESRPFIKTGGLADVVYSLSKEFSKMGHEVSIVIPFYKSIKQTQFNKVTKLYSFNVTLSWRVCSSEVYYVKKDNMNFYFIDNENCFNRDKPYGSDDDLERFAFFTLACKEVLYRIREKPDIIHMHDWHVGMLPCLIKEDIFSYDYFKNSKLIFTIHNPAFQGLFDRYYLGEFYNLSDTLYTNGKTRFKGCCSTLKSGIEYSDIVTTVSNTHKLELLSYEGGMGLNEVLNNHRDTFFGILNGIDYEEFSPTKDNLIYKNFNLVNIFKSKEENKRKLFEELHINNYGQPLYSLVSRLSWQKGMDLVMAVSYFLVSKGANLIFLGSGEYGYEQALEELRNRYPNNVAIYIGYNDTLAHKIYAASDYFIMPSLFEPCGLSQMIAQRYGTLPIVRNTGGLKDSVIGYNGNNIDSANGFSFNDYDIGAICRVGDVTLDVYHKKEIFSKLVKNAYKVDNSWKKSANEYLKIYKK